MEVYVLIEKEKNILIKILGIIFLLAGIIFGILSLFLIVCLPFAIIFVGTGYFIYTRNYEYEYSYFDGEIRFAKIINKSSRKTLKGYTMDEVTIISPSGDRSVYRYEYEEKLNVRDFTSGKKDAKVYVMIARGSNTMDMVKFEPDEKFLNEVCIKYSQKVVR